MTIRYDVERILNREVVGKTANNKNNCCNTENKSKSTLSRWREQAQKSTRTFLESQFGKSLEQFDRGDWRLTKLRCLKFLPKDKQKVINSKGSGRTPSSFYAQLSAKPASTTKQKTNTVNKVLTEKEATKLLKSIFKRELDELSFAQKRRIVDTPDIIGILSPEFVKKYNLFPGTYKKKTEAPGRKPSIVDFVKKLPNEVSLERLNKVLMSLPLKLHKPVMNEETSKVELPKVVWDKFIKRRNELPEAMKMHYARELKFIKHKPGRKPKNKNLNNKTMEDIEIEQENLERKKKKNITVVRKDTDKPDETKAPKPTNVPKTSEKKAKPSKPDRNDILEEDDNVDDLSDVTDDDLNDLLGRRPSKKPTQVPKVDKTLDEAKFLPTDQDVIKFINMQMNKALLPDEFPRSSTLPTSQWSTSEWALVDVYRDRINQKFLDNNKERINNALRRLGKTVDANFQKIAKTDKRMALNLIRFNRMFSMGEHHA